MNGVAISLKLDPSAAEIDQVLQPLVRFNWATHDTPQNFQPFMLELSGPDGEVVGGLVGMAEWDWLLLQYVFVPEALRGQGHGKALMRRAEEYARERACWAYGATCSAFSRSAFSKSSATAFLPPSRITPGAPAVTSSGSGSKGAERRQPRPRSDACGLEQWSGAIPDKSGQAFC